MSVIGKTKVSSAFTLIEILLVITILGIVLAIAAPSFSKGYSQIQLNETADDLLTVSRWAQAMAIGQSRIYALDFSSDHCSYKLIRAQQNKDFNDPDATESVPGNLGRLHRIPDAIHLDSAIDRIEFYPDGTIDQAKIQLISSDHKVALSTQEVRGMMMKVNNE